MESRRSLDRFTVAVQRIAERAPGVLRLRVYIIKTSFRFRLFCDVYPVASCTGLRRLSVTLRLLSRRETANAMAIRNRILNTKATTRRTAAVLCTPAQPHNGSLGAPLATCALPKGVRYFDLLTLYLLTAVPELYHNATAVRCDGPNTEGSTGSTPNRNSVLAATAAG